MSNRIQSPGPVVVGGVGGSGTRVIAQILMKMGFFMGSDLNDANDNLWFALLFKRPQWFMKNFDKNESEIFKGLSIFEKVMNGSLELNYDEFRFLMKATLEMTLWGNNYLGDGRGLWPIKRLVKMFTSRKFNSTTHIG